MKLRKPKPFIFHFFKRNKEDNSVKWRIFTGGEKLIVDDIQVIVPCITHCRKIRPHAVMKGIGILRFEWYKENGFKKIKAIIE